MITLDEQLKQELDELDKRIKAVNDQIAKIKRMGPKNFNVSLNLDHSFFASRDGEFGKLGRHASYSGF